MYFAKLPSVQKQAQQRLGVQKRVDNRILSSYRTLQFNLWGLLFCKLKEGDGTTDMTANSQKTRKNAPLTTYKADTILFG